MAPAKLPPGKYRNINGNSALAIGLVTAANKAHLPLFLGSYPITPASDILHELSRYKHYNVYTFQAEDEIGAAGAALGAAFGGALAATSTSGPGLSLKSETISLAIMAELPMVIVDTNVAGRPPGCHENRTGDTVAGAFRAARRVAAAGIAARSPADCFDTALEAARIAIEHMLP